MSTKALAWAVEQQTGSTLRKCILLLLADLADEQLTCYPGREYLAARAEVAPTTVSKAITQLVDGGFVRVLRRARRNGGRRSNRYLIMMYGADTPFPDIDDWVSEFVNDVEDFTREAAGQGNGAPAAPLPDGDDETAGQDNSAPAAPLPADGNGAPATHSTVLDEHSSNKEDPYPLAVNKDHSPPPPRSTHPACGDRSAAAAERIVDDARSVLRQVTANVEAVRLPTDAERDRLVGRAILHLYAGWSAQQLVDRLHGMGPLDRVASVYAVLNSRLLNLGAPPVDEAPSQPQPRPLGPWCGSASCDPTTRRQLDEQGRPLFGVDGLGRMKLYCETCS